LLSIPMIAQAFTYMVSQQTLSFRTDSVLLDGIDCKYNLNND